MIKELLEVSIGPIIRLKAKKLNEAMDMLV